MIESETSGVVLFAYNTEQINYLKLAVIAGHYIKHNMPGREVCLITDPSGWEWFNNTAPEGKYADTAFDKVVLVEASNRPNKRVHHDSPYTKFTSEFKNGNKHRVIEYTPYDKTLLIDIDYIIQNNQFDYCFDTENPVTLFHHAEDLIGRQPHSEEQYLDETGIPMLWSTVIYFNRRDPTATLFFDLWGHIADNYDYYSMLYNFPSHMFRTDFCVSIAAHILNGMGQGPIINDFGSAMIYMSQKDNIVSINDVNDWAYLVNDRQEEWKDTLALISRENVHVMNKRALERHFNKIMSLFGGDNL